MSFVLLGILNSQATGEAVSFRLQTLGGIGNDEGTSLSLDSENNLYVFGNTGSSGAGGLDFLLAKYDSIGDIQWQRTLGNANNDLGNAAEVDSLGNIFVTGTTQTGGSGGDDILLAKYNSAGTIQWQRFLGGADRDQGEGLTLDSSDNVYVTGQTRSAGAGNADFLIAKYNSSGTIQWQRALGGADFDLSYDLATDSSDNVYVIGQAPSSNYEMTIAKYNSSGTIQWQRALGLAGSDIGASIVIDSSDNIYALGRTSSSGAGNADFLLAKYNSSGTIQWQRTLGGADFEDGLSVTVDSAGNVYFTGTVQSDGAGNLDFGIAKYNSSGTIQWQRTLGGASADRGYAIRIGQEGAIYVIGETESTGEGNKDFLIGVLPNNGSLTGTYVLDGANIIYQASTLTAATSTLTPSTPSLTDSASSLTDSASSFTSSSASLTSHRVDL